MKLRTVKIALSVLLALARAGTALAEDTLPKPDPAFKGKVDPNRNNAVAAWPESAKAPGGAPNVVLILLDDVGFGASSTFGGPVATPALDALAGDGLRFNRFHVNALCSPTRGALLSGRNDHEIGFGSVVDNASGFPGYNSIWPKSAVSVAEVLRQNGYSTAAFGKWHNTPVWETSPAGPFDHWPTSLGFEYFYGFMGGDDNQWYPRLFRNTIAVEPPAVPAAGYHLTKDLVNDATQWLRQHDALTPQKPFFLYFATGATHEPHHVPKEWIQKYQGKFDQGWDSLRAETYARQKERGVIPANTDLTKRPKELPAWDSLNDAQRKLLSHQMEVYAGFLAQTDYEVGRLLGNIKAAGHYQDTVVFYIVGDNGASGEGGLDGHDEYVDGKPAPIKQRLKNAADLGGERFFNHYSAAWAWATNTPFQWTKQVASHLGGTRDPLIVSWPGHIKDAGAIRTQFHHVTDIAPTIYELTGVKFPAVVNGVKQLPLEGESLAYTFDHRDEPSPHKIQYFEMLGNRGIYQDGWWAGSRHLLPWEIDLEKWLKRDPNQNPWELYNLTDDFSQAHDLAEQNPEKLKELVKLFDSEARRNNVYPLVPNFSLPPEPSPGTKVFVYQEGVQRIPAAVAPSFGGRAHRITAQLELPPGGAEGVILALGGHYGGFSLYLKDGRLAYEVNYMGDRAGIVSSPDPLPPGKLTIEIAFTPAPLKGRPLPPFPGLFLGPGVARLSINGRPAGEASIKGDPGFNQYDETLDIGSDLGTPVSAEYASPFRFTGHIEKVTVELL